ncbi:helix-turn-helix domain-containing protein [Staphylococcus haemolyticus]|uniref:helix-turn-helix domain-containing protein n=1 Tax=Staphylococcus haemolyticus TaxID=1283 RepID=UPI001A94BD20|nr:helix-turn-helix transcriptional regulator [Staphylococcus haemolyticus]MCI2943563.1 helix-turn-helix domain-containing protein [Staphylococcus haemolyticus]MCI2946709.1 helix-turn-helix domain-containing protein [Staphylococcus haemolyticus]QTK08848.1 helix-turn-helix domain-containing protein [Staphylococcus haemolyticus]QTK11010.1 helix-turn-helix domain-containing protein [Staphylococcus haemolyticus]QTK13195.1 helix-turn-helix domain-containing protein [Staphylococcus haemolyticus]
MLILKDLLKELRESRGLNKQELANRVDISRSYISTIESGKVEKPTKKTLLKIAYVFDPEGEERIYNKLLKSSGYKEDNANEEFKNYIINLNKDFRSNKKIDYSTISKMKYRINKKDKSIVMLDKPYMDIMWLLEQEDYEIYLGYEENEVLVDEHGIAYEKPLVLDEEDRINLLSQISNFQGSLIATKQALKVRKEFDDLISDSNEYSLIFDLLNDKIKNKSDITNRLASINKDREIFLAKEYYDEIMKASKEKNALKLQELIRMTKLSQLKNFLNKGD